MNYRIAKIASLSCLNIVAMAAFYLTGCSPHEVPDGERSVTPKPVAGVTAPVHAEPALAIRRIDKILPKEACETVDVPDCDVKNVDAYSTIDLNGGGKKAIIFAYGGGSCGEQHYVFMHKGLKWVQIANWCGMDGGGYNVLRSKHNGYFDIDTLFGKLRFNGQTYPDTTVKPEK